MIEEELKRVYGSQKNASGTADLDPNDEYYAAFKEKYHPEINGNLYYYREKAGDPVWKSKWDIEPEEEYYMSWFSIPYLTDEQIEALETSY